ncbi:MAG: hypothetical protein IIT57_10575 [Treponema sp.]|nr:hypothetical protein [Treponema sp.]MBQ1670387.1 hypothetical protein [Treponema sp.]MBQ1727348.1 hypothetical protein [Treponema sp.]MBQ5450470.1 hypothetical protein [Treponema sp.]
MKTGDDITEWAPVTEKIKESSLKGPSLLFSYVPFCNVLVVYGKLISNALHNDVFVQWYFIAGKKIGAENDNAPAAPTSRKLDIGESLSAYLQANIKILHFFK